MTEVDRPETVVDFLEADGIVAEAVTQEVDLRADSSLMGGTIFVAVVAQVVLWFAGYVRDDWHASLVKMRMRASGLG